MSEQKYGDQPLIQTNNSDGGNEKQELILKGEKYKQHFLKVIDQIENVGLKEGVGDDQKQQQECKFVIKESKRLLRNIHNMFFDYLQTIESNEKVISDLKAKQNGYLTYEQITRFDNFKKARADRLQRAVFLAIKFISEKFNAKTEEIFNNAKREYISEKPSELEINQPKGLVSKALGFFFKKDNTNVEESNNLQSTKDSKLAIEKIDLPDNIFLPDEIDYTDAEQLVNWATALHYSNGWELVKSKIEVKK